ncbi:MAG: VOC family protein [Gammaproteobacteria bacterium]|nr:VOC family protein [Gammaproteobacteria bacterium]
MVGLLENGGPRPLPKTLPRLCPGDAVLMIETDDVQAVYRRMQTAGTPILKPPKKQEVTGAGGVRWDATFLFALDPDDYLVDIKHRGPIRSAGTGEGVGAIASGEVIQHREFFDYRYGQLHLRTAIPQQTTGIVLPVMRLHQTRFRGVC